MPWAISRSNLLPKNIGIEIFVLTYVYSDLRTVFKGEEEKMTYHKLYLNLVFLLFTPSDIDILK